MEHQASSPRQKFYTAFHALDGSTSAQPPPPSQPGQQQPGSTIPQTTMVNSTATSRRSSMVVTPGRSQPMSERGITDCGHFRSTSEAASVVSEASQQSLPFSSAAALAPSAHPSTIHRRPRKTPSVLSIFSPGPSPPRPEPHPQTNTGYQGPTTSSSWPEPQTVDNDVARTHGYLLSRQSSAKGGQHPVVAASSSFGAGAVDVEAQPPLAASSPAQPTATPLALEETNNSNTNQLSGVETSRPQQQQEQEDAVVGRHDIPGSPTTSPIRNVHLLSTAEWERRMSQHRLESMRSNLFETSTSARKNPTNATSTAQQLLNNTSGLGGGGGVGDMESTTLDDGKTASIDDFLALSGGGGVASYHIERQEDLLLPCPREVTVMQREIERLMLQLQLTNETRDEQIKMAIENEQVEASDKVAELTGQWELEKAQKQSDFEKLEAENMILKQRLDSLADHGMKIRKLEEENRGLRAKMTEAEKGWLQLLKKKEREWEQRHTGVHEELTILQTSKRTDMARIAELEELLQLAQTEVETQKEIVATQPVREEKELASRQTKIDTLHAKLEESDQLNKALWLQLDAANQELAEVRHVFEEKKIDYETKLAHVRDDASETVKLYMQHIQSLDGQLNQIMGRNAALVVEVEQLRSQLEVKASTEGHDLVAAPVNPIRNVVS